jgi:hypothetical protein
MTSTLLRPPETPEWDKAMHAQNESELLKKFIVWLQEEKGAISHAWSADRLLAIYYNINLDKLADEQEQWEQYIAFMQKELGLDDEATTDI